MGPAKKKRKRRRTDYQVYEPKKGNPRTGYFRLGQIRLYVSDEVLASRLPDGEVEKLAAYCKALEWVGTEYFGRLGCDFGSLGVLIVVGIKPERQTRLWCETVDGELPTEVWDTFVDLERGAGGAVRPAVTAPVAVALECLVGAGPSTPFPEFPAAWSRAAAQHKGRLVVPDELFELVFAD